MAEKGSQELAAVLSKELVVLLQEKKAQAAQKKTQAALAARAVCTSSQVYSVDYPEVLECLG
jgi:hypothetical protein